MAITIQIKGLDGLQARIGKIAKEAEQKTTVALNVFAKNVEADAKRAAPANEGFLRNSIHGEVRGLQASITVSAGYAAYLEFGTRKFASAYVATLPADWQAYAATFKGKSGGTFAQFLQDIMKWVEQKGIGGIATKSGNVSKSKDSKAAQKQAAYAIAISILRNGIRAQPYLYPATVKHTPKLIQDIKKIFT